MITVFAPFIELLISTQGIDELAFYRRIASINILQNKDVQTELKVTEAQRTKFNEFGQSFNTNARSASETLSKGEISETEYDKRIQSAQELLQTNIILSLKDEQVTRLGQISLQKAGTIVVLKPIVSAKLGMTEAQINILKAELKTVGMAVAELQRKAKEPIVNKYRAMTPKDDAEREKLQTEMDAEIKAVNEKIQPDLLKLRKTFDDLVDKTLTDGQKKTWTDLKGPTFQPPKG